MEWLLLAQNGLSIRLNLPLANDRYEVRADMTAFAYFLSIGLHLFWAAAADLAQLLDGNP
jgi:hypothetical protein